MTAELVAGRELDALVATRVMGWHKDKYGKWWLDADGAQVDRVHAIDLNNYQPVFNPSATDGIAAAWQVVEYLRNQQQVYVTLGSLVGPRWWAECDGPGLRREIRAYADTAPLAICAAALKATGHEVASLVLSERVKE